MLNIKGILCPVDFSEFSKRAYWCALSLAKRYKAKLFVHHVVELWQHPAANFAPAKSFSEFYQNLLDRTATQLQEFVNAYPDQVGRECVVQEGTASDCILSFAQSKNVDMIVMGTHGRRGFDHLMLGSVTERVLRRASCPVLVVRDPSREVVKVEQSPDAIRLKRIVYCADFSKSSWEALDYALSLSAEYDAELTMMHVVERVATSSEAFEGAKAKAVALLEGMVSARSAQSAKAKIVVCAGEAYREIIKFASENQTDMVVMAVRGRGALDLATFGSTTHRVIRLGPCMVLAVRVCQWPT